MPERGDAKLLQVLRRQARKNRLVYLVLAECRLVLPEAQAPQPDHNVHDGAPTRGWRTSSSGRREGVQDRLDYGCLRGSQKSLRSYRQRQCLSVIVKIRSDLEILILPPQKAPARLLIISRNTLHGAAERRRPRLPSGIKPLRCGQILVGFLKKNRRWADRDGAP